MRYELVHLADGRHAIVRDGRVVAAFADLREAHAYLVKATKPSD